MRQDVELLTATVGMDNPLNAWPLGAAPVCQEDFTGLPPEAAAAARRLRDACAEAAGGGVDIEISIANDNALIRDFGNSGRRPLDLSSRWTRTIGRLYLSLGAGYRAGQDGADLHLEPTYAAVDLGGWALYAGYIETWWGPGHEQALLFSNNARPFPKLGIKRLVPTPVDLPLVRYLGPVTAEAFVGVLTERRSDFDDPAVAGMRLAFAPLPGLEIGLNRALQLCGAGRPCDGRTILDALIAFGNRDNTGTASEPGNQLAGFDISVTRKFGAVTAQIYVEAEGEDENHFIVEQYGRLAGIDLTGPAGTDGTTWSLRAEYANTLASKLFGTGRRYAGSLYNHSIYTEGFRYRDDAIGSSLDTDGQMLTLAGALTDSRDRRVYASWRRVQLNRTDRAGHRFASFPSDFNLLTVGAELPTGLRRRFRIEARLTDDRGNADGRPARGQVEVGWQTRL